MDINDFTDAIDNLKKRASSARKTRSIIASILFILCFFIFVIIYINTTSGLAKGMNDIYHKLSKNNNEKIDNGIDNIYSKILIDSYLPAESIPPTSKTKNNSLEDEKLLQVASDEFEQLLKNVDATSKLLDSYANWKSVRYKLDQGGNNENIINSVTTSVATIAFSICSILLLLFLVQISVMFMKYYAQLAEIYESQALALIVSEGNTSKAISFAKEFSPKAISIGRSPDSVYEKAFKIINNIINKKEN